MKTKKQNPPSTQSESGFAFFVFLIVILLFVTGFAWDRCQKLETAEKAVGDEHAENFSNRIQIANLGFQLDSLSNAVGAAEMDRDAWKRQSDIWEMMVTNLTSYNCGWMEGFSAYRKLMEPPPAPIPPPEPWWKPFPMTNLLLITNGYITNCTNSIWSFGTITCSNALSNYMPYARIELKPAPAPKPEIHR